jgi:hypothetical protein
VIGLAFQRKTRIAGNNLNRRRGIRQKREISGIRRQRDDLWIDFVETK